MRRLLKYKICIIVLFLSVFVNYSKAQDSHFDSLVTNGINQIYSIKFDEAAKTFNELKKSYPKHPSGLFFEAMITWWKIILDRDNEEYDDLFDDQLEEVVDFCDEILDEEPDNLDAMFFKGGAIGFKGRLSSIRKDWFDAAAEGKEALPLVYKVYKTDSTNVDAKLGLGIYNYYAEAIPERYPVVKPFMMFFPEGDKSKGLEYLYAVALNGKYAKIETRYFLMNLNYIFERNYKEALRWADSLHNQFPTNPRFERYKGRITIRSTNYTKAAPVFENIYTKHIEGMPGYSKKFAREAVYYLGMRYKRESKPDSAAIYFEKCNELSFLMEDEESGYVANSHLYLAMMYDLMGKRKEALLTYEKVLDLDEYKESHEKAEKYIENPYQ